MMNVMIMAIVVCLIVCMMVMMDKIYLVIMIVIFVSRTKKYKIRLEFTIEIIILEHNSFTFFCLQPNEQTTLKHRYHWSR